MPSQGRDRVVDEGGRGRGARRQPDHARAVQPPRVDVVGVLDEVGRDAEVAGELDQGPASLPPSGLGTSALRLTG